MTEINPRGRSQRRAEERRSQILTAATHLFAQKGFHATTTRDIANLADLSEGTLYNYFGNKEQIYSALLDRLIKLQSSVYTVSMPTDAQSFLDSLFEMQQEFLLDNLELVKAVLPEVIVNEEFRAKYFQDLYSPTISFLLLQLQAREVLGQIRPINHEMGARFLIGMLYGLSFLHLIGDPVIYENWDSLLGQAITIIYEGTGPV